MCEGAHYSAAHFHSPGLDGFTPPLLQVLWSTFNPASPDLDEKTKADVLKELPLHTTLEQFIALYRLSLSLSLSLSLCVCMCVSYVCMHAYSTHMHTCICLPCACAYSHACSRTRSSTRSTCVPLIQEIHARMFLSTCVRTLAHKFSCTRSHALTYPLPFALYRRTEETTRHHRQQRVKDQVRRFEPAGGGQQVVRGIRLSSHSLAQHLGNDSQPSSQRSVSSVQEAGIDRLRTSVRALDILVKASMGDDHLALEASRRLAFYARICKSR